MLFKNKSRKPHRIRVFESTAFTIFVFCAILLCFFLPFLLQRKVLAPLDIVQTFYEPWAQFDASRKNLTIHNHFVQDAVDQYLIYQHIAAVSLREDGYIGWNPLIFAGKPEYANTMGLYFDWTMQLYAVLDFWNAWHVGLICQFAIAGIGMLLFLRSQSLPAPVCLAGAIAYTGNSQFIIWIYHRWALGSFCWVPWLLLALQWAKGRTVASVMGLSVFTALALLGGSLQYDAFILLVILCVVISWQFGETRARKVAIKEAAVIFASTVLALALAAKMLVPCTRAFLDNAAVGHHRGTLAYKEGWLEPVLHPVISICSVFPSALGDVRTLDVAKVFKGDRFDILYFGFLPVAIAFCCVGRKATPLAARLFMLLGLLLPLTPMEGLLYHRVSVLFIVGGVWAFADYWHKMDHESARLWGNRTLLIFLAVSVIWGIASVLIAVNHVVIADFLKSRIADRLQDASLGMFKAWMMARTERWVAEFPIWSARQVMPWALAALSLVLLRLRHAFPQHYVTYALSAVLVSQVFIFASDWVTLSLRPQKGVLPVNKEIEYLKQLVGNDRVYLVPAKGKPPFFPPNILAAYGIATLQGYESLWPKTMWERAGYAESPEELSKENVRFVVVQVGHTESGGCWQLHPHGVIDTPSGPSNVAILKAMLGMDDSSRRYSNTSHESLDVSGRRNAAVSPCWPLVYKGSSFEIFRNDQAVPRYRALSDKGTVPVEVLSETFNDRKLRVAPGAEIVRVSENWSSGWRYRIDHSGWHPAVQSSDMSISLPLLRLDVPTIVELKFEPSDWGRRLSTWAWITVMTALFARTLYLFAR